MLTIKIKYHDPNMPRLKKTENGDCIDLYVCDIKSLAPITKPIEFNETTQEWSIYKDDRIKVNLGISMELPEGWRANIYPRSSLFPRHGLLLTNSIGIIDHVYKGDNDIWSGIFYATQNTKIKKYEAILQFEIVPVMPEIKLIEVSSLNNANRGGFGTSDGLLFLSKLLEKNKMELLISINKFLQSDNEKINQKIKNIYTKIYNKIKDFLIQQYDYIPTASTIRENIDIRCSTLPGSMGLKPVLRISFCWMGKEIFYKTIEIEEIKEEQNVIQSRG